MKSVHEAVARPVQDAAVKAAQDAVPKVVCSSMRWTFAIGLTALLAACASTSGGVATPIPEIVTCAEPVLTLVEGEALQRHGDIVIDASMSMPRCEDRIEIVFERRSASLGEALAGISEAALRGSTGEVYVTRREITTLGLEGRDAAGERVAAGDFGFLLTITNQSERVFRGEGAVFAYQVDGTSEAVSQDRYSTLLTGAVLPQQRRDFEIRLPHSGINDGAVVSLFLYDIVVERDEAGNPVRRGNFEWTYAMSHTRQERMTSQKSCDQTLPAMPMPTTVTAAALEADEGRCP